MIFCLLVCWCEDPTTIQDTPFEVAKRSPTGVLLMVDFSSKFSAGNLHVFWGVYARA